MPKNDTQRKNLWQKILFTKEYFMEAIPFDDRDGVIWFNGEMVPWRQARLHVLSHALHYASSVFEGERSYAGNIFKLTEHSERLVLSAKTLGFELPYSVAEIDAACIETCKQNDIIDGYVRPVAWRGSEMMGVSAQATRINIAIAAWPWPSYFSPEARMIATPARPCAVARATIVSICPSG